MSAHVEVERKKPVASEDIKEGFPVVQGLRICFAMQGTPVRSLAKKSPHASGLVH